MTGRRIRIAFEIPIEDWERVNDEERKKGKSSGTLAAETIRALFGERAALHSLAVLGDHRR